MSRNIFFTPKINATGANVEVSKSFIVRTTKRSHEQPQLAQSVPNECSFDRGFYHVINTTSAEI